MAYCSNDRNSDTLSIECCHPDDSGQFTPETYDALVKLVRWLNEYYELTPEQVIRHYDVTGKSCPAAYPEYATGDYLLSSAAWERFRNRLVGDEVKSEITLSGANYPETLEKGDRFVIKGKIKSNAKLKSVTVVVEKKNGVDLAYATKKRYTNLRSFDLSNIDPYIAFRKLPVGEYRYKIKAEDVNGTKKTLMLRPFKVVKTIKKGTTK